MYYADMTPYIYLEPLHPERRELNIGWLDRRYDFPTGEVEDSILERVFGLCQRPVNRTRGLHSCNLCSVVQYGCLAVRNGIEVSLGNAEIRVPDGEAIVFAAPTMIYHYMSEHHYRPPQRFLDALLRQP